MPLRSKPHISSHRRASSSKPLISFDEIQPLVEDRAVWRSAEDNDFLVNLDGYDGDVKLVPGDPPEDNVDWDEMNSDDGTSMVGLPSVV
jgi:hypothetical protein